MKLNFGEKNHEIFRRKEKFPAAAIAAMMLVAGMTACGSSDSTGTADSGATTGTDVKKNWYYSIGRT